MDYHFLKPRKLATNGGISLLKIFGRFLPLFLLVAVLPFLIGLVVSPPNIGFFTKADEPSSLRIWIEPANVIISPGKTVELLVVAEFEGDNKLIPEISLNLATRGGVMITGDTINYSIPFSGKTEIGRVFVKGVTSGEAIVSVLRDSIKVTAFDGELKIATADANVIVKK